MEALKIIAGSWPIAFMFLGSVAGGLMLYLIRWFKQSDRENKAYRATQAVVVRNREDG